MTQSSMSHASVTPDTKERITHRPIEGRFLTVCAIALLAAFYILTAKLGLMIGSVSGFAALVWPPTGIALAALVLFGMRLWPGVALGAFFVNYLSGASFFTACGMSFGNTVEALVGAYLLHRRGFLPSLSRLKHVFSLVVLAALASTSISASIGVLSLWLGGVIQSNAVQETWSAWWVGDMLGNLIVAPLLLIWGDRPKIHLRRSASWIVETIAVSLFLVLVNCIIFGLTPLSALSPALFQYLIFPLMTWIALRFGIRATVTTTFVLSILSIWATTRGMGPFANETLSTGLKSLQYFMATVAVSAITLAVAVDERSRFEREGRESLARLATEERLRSMVHTAYDAFIGTDAKGVVTDWNAQAENTFGWTAEQAIGRSIETIIIPQLHREAFVQGLAAFKETGKSTFIAKRLEMLARHRNGQEVPVELTITPIRHGESYVFSAFLHEITERKTQERMQGLQLAISSIVAESKFPAMAVNDTLKTICERLNWDYGGLWHIDASGESLVAGETWHRTDEKLAAFAAASRTFSFLLGKGLPGRVWQSQKTTWVDDVSMDENFPRAPFSRAAGLHGGVAFPLSVGNRCIGVLEFFARATPRPDDKLLDLLSDIGTRVGSLMLRLKAEEGQRQSDDRFRKLVDAVKDYAIFLMDPAGDITTWNAGAERIKGYTADDIIGKNFACFYTADALAQKHPQYELEVAARVGRYEEEGQRKRKDGSTFWASVSITALRDESGAVAGFAKVVRDITDQRRAREDLERVVGERTAELSKTAEELRHAKELAEEANAAKSAFLTNMSHELRTPLGVVLGFSELLTGTDVSPTDRQNYVAGVKRNGELLSSLINDILDLSKIEAGKLEMDLQDVSLEAILTDITAMLSLHAQEKALRLIILPEQPLPQSIRTDPLRLRQILINIVGNALKFTDRGFVEVKIRPVVGDNDQKYLAFIVKDSGPGIDAISSAKLFEPFAQADASTTRKFGGSGLGLILSRRLARRLGGDVVLTESRPSHGSTFTITIDPGPDDRQGALTPPVEAIAPSEWSEKHLSGMNILLAEDAPDNQLLVGRYLKNAGATVATANNGQEALLLARSQVFDVILMDLQMPLMDGYEATTELRRGGYKRPIIALTAHALKEERQRCLRSGFDDHVSKPVNRITLIQSIAHVVRGKLPLA